MSTKTLRRMVAVLGILALIITLSGCFSDGGNGGGTVTYTRYTFSALGTVTDNDGTQSTAVSYQTTSKKTTPRTERLPNMPQTYTDNLYLVGRANGGCDALEGDMKVTVVFVNDSESSWTATAMAAEKADHTAAAKYLTDAAKTYGKTVTVSFQYATATVSGTPTLSSDTAWAERAAKAAGLPALSTVNDTLETKYGVDAAPVVFCLNRHGRSFALPDFGGEHIILYAEGNALAHELLHLFGAKDYYFPDTVKTAATQIFGQSIMLEGETTPVDSLSAYLVGWTDTPDAKALQFLQKTNHLTDEDLRKAQEDNTYTGYVTDYKLGSATYTGNLKDGAIADGKGILVQSDGSKYEGNFKNGQYNGQGTFYHKDGSKYVGGVKNGQYHGQGTLTYADGTVYTGGFENSQLHGQGTLKWTDGNVYVGAFVNGEREGQGTLTFYNGDKYVGTFVKGKFHGQGTYTWKNGSSQSGYWENGEFVG